MSERGKRQAAALQAGDSTFLKVPSKGQHSTGRVIVSIESGPAETGVINCPLCGNNWRPGRYTSSDSASEQVKDDDLYQLQL